MAVGRNIRIEAALAHGGPQCVLRLHSVGVALQLAGFIRDVYVSNEAFQPTHIYFPPRWFGEISPVRRTFQAGWSFLIASMQ